MESWLVQSSSNLRGRRSKGTGKGIRARDRARKEEENNGLLAGVPLLFPLLRAQIPPSPSPFNAARPPLVSPPRPGEPVVAMASRKISPVLRLYGLHQFGKNYSITSKQRMV